MNNFVGTKIKKYSDTPGLIYIYYFILLLITLSWTNSDENIAPNTILRVLVTILLVVPLFKYYHITPAIITLFSTIRLFSVAPYGYIPTEMYYYLLTVFVVYLYNLKRINCVISSKLFIIILLLIFFSNIINQNFDAETIMFLFIIIFSSKLIYDSSHIRLLEIGFIIISLCLSIYALIFLSDFARDVAVESDAQRMYWTDPNYLGSVLIIGIIISIYMLTYKVFDKLYIKILLFITFILGFITLGLLASRGAFVALILPIIYIFIKKIKSIWSLLAILTFGSSLIFIILYTDIFTALIYRFSDETVSTGSERTDIWVNSSNLFFNEDFFVILFGGGTNYATKLCGIVLGEEKFSPHNNYLQILYDYGLVGFIAFLMFFVRIIIVNRKRVLATALIISFLVTCFTLVPLMYLPFWILLLLIMSYNSFSEEEYNYYIE